MSTHSSAQTTYSSLLTACLLGGLAVLYLQRRRGSTRRAAIEIGEHKTRMLVADVDYAGKVVIKEVHSREIRHSAAKALEDVVRALVAEARDVGAAQATVYERPGTRAAPVPAPVLVWVKHYINKLPINRHRAAATRTQK